MPLDYTPNYGLRIPQIADRRTLADFQRVFRNNFLVIDTRLKADDDRLNALEDGGVTGGSGGAEPANDSGLAQLRTRLSAMELKSVTGLRKDDNGLWYAYNKDGHDVAGPFDFGSGNAVTTLSEYFNAVEDDSGVYEDPTPVSGATVGPNRTLAGILNAVEDDSIVYEDPTPISA